MNLRKYLFNSSIITIIAVLFILFIAAGCSVLLEKQNQIIEQPIITENTLDTSTWQTYRNEQYGFEVKYSNEFKVYDDYDSVGQIFIGKNETHRSLKEGLMIYINNQNIGEKVLAIKNRDALTEILIDESNYELNDINGYKLVVTAAIGYEDAHYLFNKNGLTFEIVWLNGDADQEKILSTFKFIEPSSAIDTSTWKIYRNEEYGFEFKYPIKGIIDDSIDKQLVFRGRADKPYSGETFWMTVASTTFTNINDLIMNEKDTESIRKIVFAGQPALDVSYGSMGGCNDTQYIKVINAGYVYSLIPERCFIGVFSTDPEYSYDVKTILSTFKFIEPSSAIDTSTWKTYRNEQYGFEFKYPPNISPGEGSETNYLFTFWIDEGKSGNDLDFTVLFNSHITDEKREGCKGIYVVLGNNSWYRCEVHSTIDYIQYYLEYGKNLYRINVYNFENEEVLKRILSTFKFIEPAGTIDLSKKFSAQILKNQIGSWARSASDKVDVIVRYDETTVSNKQVVSELVGQGAEILFNSDHFYRVTVRIDETKLLGLVDFGWLVWVEPVPPPPIPY